MTSKHTPGPWYIGKQDNFKTIINCMKETPRGIGAIATVNTLVKNKEVSFANARLIAAAPAMYTFLEEKADQGDEKAKKILGEINASQPRKVRSHD